MTTTGHVFENSQSINTYTVDHNSKVPPDKPFQIPQILNSSKLKEFSDDYFEFDENSRKLSERVENTMGKGEIALTSNFYISHSVFKRIVQQTCKTSLGKG